VLVLFLYCFVGMWSLRGMQIGCCCPHEKTPKDQQKVPRHTSLDCLRGACLRTLDALFLFSNSNCFSFLPFPSLPPSFPYTHTHTHTPMLPLDRIVNLEKSFDLPSPIAISLFLLSFFFSLYFPPSIRRPPLRRGSSEGFLKIFSSFFSSFSNPLTGNSCTCCPAKDKVTVLTTDFLFTRAHTHAEKERKKERRYP
jgi:hypothetical protein